MCPGCMTRLLILHLVVVVVRSLSLLTIQFCDIRWYGLCQFPLAMFSDTCLKRQFTVYTKSVARHNKYRHQHGVGLGSRTFEFSPWNIFSVTVSILKGSSCSYNLWELVQIFDRPSPTMDEKIHPRHQRSIVWRQSNETPRHIRNPSPYPLPTPSTFGASIRSEGGLKRPLLSSEIGKRNGKRRSKRVEIRTWFCFWQHTKKFLRLFLNESNESNTTFELLFVWRYFVEWSWWFDEYWGNDLSTMLR